MTEPSEKWRERLLYLISPIGLLLLWQILVGLGFGDRRFIPTPSDIATRFWQLTVSGELVVNTLATCGAWSPASSSAWCRRSPSACSWRCSARCASSSIR